jgi:rhodanese-related sulfurtransferase
MSTAPPQRLSAAELPAWRAAHPDALVLDARDSARHAAGHLDGALRLDGRNHETLLLREPRSRPVLICCYHGNASQTYAHMFADFGFTTVADLIGGWAAWEQYCATTAATATTTAAPAAPAAPVRRAVPAALAQWLSNAGFDATDPDAPGAHGNTPLMHAAWRGDHHALDGLLAAGVRLDAVNGDGNNALWLACVHGEPALIRALVAHGVPLDHANLTGATCLMYAASAGKAQVVETLLQLGADATLATQDDYTALDMAASVDCLRLLRQADMARRRAA